MFLKIKYKAIDQLIANSYITKIKRFFQVNCFVF